MQHKRGNRSNNYLNCLFIHSFIARVEEIQTVVGFFGVVNYSSSEKLLCFAWIFAKLFVDRKQLKLLIRQSLFEV